MSPSNHPAAHRALPAVVPAAGDVVLRYRGLGPFTSRSHRTGRLYACGGFGAWLRVDAADASVLLKTRRFKRA